MATGARKVSIDARDQREGADRGSSSEALAPGAQGPSPCPWWPFQWANKRWGELVLSKRHNNQARARDSMHVPMRARLLTCRSLAYDSLLIC